MRDGGKVRREKQASRMLLAIAAALLVLAGMACLTACAESDTIKEIVYTRDADEVDANNPTKVQVFQDDADELASSVSESGTPDESAQTTSGYKVEYSSNPQTQLPVAKYVYDGDSDNDSEASEPVREVEDQGTEKHEDKTNPDDSDSSGPKDSGSGDGGSGEKADSNAGNENKKGQDSGKGAGGDVTVYNTTGNKAEIPSVERIAACGQLAVIVQMLGGEGALVAADEELLGSAFAKVFADEGAADIAVGWSGSGGDSGSANAKEIAAAKPDTVLVTSSDSFTKKQKTKLSKAGVSLTVVPPLNSASNIKKTVKIIGEMLAQAGANVNGKTSQELAQSYIDYHDGMLEEINESNDYAMYGNTLFDDDAKAPDNKASAKRWTLLVDDWDYSATYVGTFSNGTRPVKSYEGVGFATSGYKTSPVSYYLSYGGVVNRAATISYLERSQGAKVLVWQFGEQYLSSDESSWRSVSKDGPFSSEIYSMSGTGLEKTLLKVAGSKYDDAGLGSSEYPAIIVTTQKMRDAFIADGSHKNGIYTPYETQTFGAGEQGSYVGVPTENGMLPSSIDTDCVLEDSVLVNPCGLFSDWTQGSVESVLEAAWVADKDTCSGFDSKWAGDIKEEVRDFYLTFYRYKLSDDELDSILEGPKS